MIGSAACLLFCLYCRRYVIIDKAKSKLLGVDLKDFKRSLKDLDDILVNPVTIPRDWGIDYIPNLLRAYFDEIMEEQVVTSREYLFNEYLSEFLA